MKIVSSLKKLYNKIFARENGGDDSGLQNVFPSEAHMVSEEDLKLQRAVIFSCEPRISLITPLYNTPERYLTELLDSVQRQTYGNWELCLFDCSDAGNGMIKKICQKYKNMDARIMYERGTNRGISENTNHCIEMSSGDYIGLLDHDDILHPSALYEVVKAINREQCDFIYTDEIKFTEDIDHCFAPNFKPDYARDELRAHNYICHFNVYKRSLYEQTQGYRKEFDGSQDHDIVLRLTEKAKKITHIPQVLYYWRVHSNSVALNIDVKSYATDAGIRAVNGQLERIGGERYVKSVIGNIPCYRMYLKQENCEEVTVVIWDAKETEQLLSCIQSVRDSERHQIRLIILPSVYAKENLSTACSRKLDQNDCVYVERGGRTESELWNFVMDKYVNKYVLFLHASLSIVTKGMFQEMLLYLTQEDAACIDAKIIMDDKLISGGLVLGSTENGTVRRWKCRGRGLGVDEKGYEDYLIHARNVLTVSGCCTCFSRQAWEALGRFRQCDSFCLEYGVRADCHDYWNVWTPYVVADGDITGQVERMENMPLKSDVLIDPYYNPNLERFGLD